MKPYKVAIEFTRNGKLLTFVAEPNSANDKTCWQFRPLPTMWCGSVHEAKTLVKGIRDKHKDAKDISDTYFDRRKESLNDS